MQMAQHYEAAFSGARLTLSHGEGHMIFFSHAREIPGTPEE
jgi:hypothetical protein